GIKDVKKKLLRMIGDPAQRYREDPVRIIRAVRFAAKLGFEIEPKTRAPIKELAGLLDNVPQSRTFDEMIKLLQTGHALASIDARIGDISGRGKLAADMREIWLMQPRFERRAPHSATTLLAQPRFRAGLDFLRLRGKVGEADPALAEWWETFFQAGDDERYRM